MGEFFKNAFRDMAESARAQHEVDKGKFRRSKGNEQAICQESCRTGKTSGVDQRSK